MCTAVIAQEILDALQARIDNKSVFTAFDVTTDARDKTTDHISHRDVRRIVHEEFDTGQFPDTYNREDFLSLKNGQTAMCYYPDGKSAADHPEALQVAPPIGQVPPYVKQAQASQASSTKKGGSTKDGDAYICEATDRGVINIPKAIVDKVSIVGGNYDISINGTIVFKAPDGQGRLRISSSKLGGGSKFRMEVDTDNNTITVEQA